MDHPWFEDISRCFFVWDSFSETKSPKTSLYLCMSSIKSQNFFPLPWPESLHWSRSDLASNEAGWRSMKSTSLSIIILSFHFADCNHSGCHSIMFADLLILSLRLYGWWLVVSSVSLFFFRSNPSNLEFMDRRVAVLITSRRKKKTQIVIHLQQKAVGELGTSERWFVVILDE